ncbi:uncharacterized protein LOC127749647 [Frankliniella occidentalis]|uniref:Uncharacterized protein LOC127749647 n=1 Tax=Frankliniella occidentalis TaxID=133901 RepID=A0A9C6U3P5_FRAOC|nr:uncharacterized protein LOC127749647 [Frankliniella occidentalis]
MEKVVHNVDSAPVLVSMTVPKSSSLYCFTARIDPEDMKDPSARSDFHWQTFKCRLLVFSAPVLVCPVRSVDGPLRDLTVVCRRSELDEQHEQLPQPPSEVRAKLAELNLTLIRVRPLSDSEYASCLEYTLQAKLAPLWSPLAMRLVQGKDFLTCGEPRDSVSLRINVSEWNEEKSP